MASHLLLEGVELNEAPKGSFIVELGSVREPGPMPSSLYFSQAAKRFGLRFRTVDFSERSWRLAQSYVGAEAVLQEAATFLRAFHEGPIAVLYLDNFDYPYDEAHAKALAGRCEKDYAEHGEAITCRRSAQVHFEQVVAAIPKMTLPSWIIIDNTHRHRGLWTRLRRPFWGKGERVVPYALRHGFVIVKEGLGGVMLARAARTPSTTLTLLQLYCSGGRAKRLYEALGYRAPTLVQLSAH